MASEGPPPDRAAFIAALRAEGVKAEEIGVLVWRNPARLPGLEPR